MSKLILTTMLVVTIFGSYLHAGPISRYSSSQRPPDFYYIRQQVTGGAGKDIPWIKVDLVITDSRKQWQDDTLRKTVVQLQRPSITLRRKDVTRATAMLLREKNVPYSEYLKVEMKVSTCGTPGMNPWINSKTYPQFTTEGPVSSPDGRTCQAFYSVGWKR